LKKQILFVVQIGKSYTKTEAVKMIRNNPCKRQASALRVNKIKLYDFAYRNGYDRVDVTSAGADITYSYIVLSRRRLKNAIDPKFYSFVFSWHEDFILPWKSFGMEDRNEYKELFARRK